MRDAIDSPERPDAEYPSKSSSVTVPCCPKCQSFRVDTRNLASKIGGSIGAVVGATSGITLALSGAETRSVVGAGGGPVTAIGGAIAGAVIAGLTAGSAGCATGSVFGEIVDRKLLNNFLCHACGHTFGRSSV